MKAHSLSICIPADCNKNCPYCISRMTWAPKANVKTFLENLHVAKRMAQTTQIADVVITSKGEPCEGGNMLGTSMAVVKQFSDWPVVVQTNGIFLNENPGVHAVTLQTYGVNVVAVSIDDWNALSRYSMLWKAINGHHMIARITVMLTPDVCARTLDNWVAACNNHEIKQLSFREVTIPDHGFSGEAQKTAEWITRNVKDEPIVDFWIQSFNEDMKHYPEIRRLSYGAVIKDVRGVAVTLFPYCVQDCNGNDDIRSLIYHQDGHMYTTWSSPASLIF